MKCLILMKEITLTFKNTPDFSLPETKIVWWTGNFIIFMSYNMEN